MFLEAIPMLLNGNKKVFLLLCSIKLFCVFFVSYHALDCFPVP